MAAAERKTGKGAKKPSRGSKRRKPGLPKEESVVSTTTFTSPKSGRRYRIMRTTETDPYDKPTKHGKKHR